ncbi:MAG: hypothetical protein RR355_03130, partial [Oscillospiraceae bacterium]
MKEQKSKVKNNNKIKKRKYRKPVNWLILLFGMTVFQIICAVQIITNGGEDVPLKTILFVFGAYIVVEWGYFIVFAGILRRKSFEIELIAFFLTGIGLSITTSVYPKKAITQLIAVLLGVAVFCVMIWILSDTQRVMKLRTPIAVLTIVALLFTLVFAKE